MAEKCSDASGSGGSGGSDPTDGSPQEESKAAGGWWDSWLTSAKTKSAEVYTMVKKDLDEIGSAVKSEASHVFSTTSNAIGKTLKLDEPESPANAMKKSFSTFIGQMHTVLNPEPDDEEDTEVILSSGDTTTLTIYKKEVEALQRVDATFLVEAAGEQFAAWRASLEPRADGGVLSPRAAARRLDGSATLRAQYHRLVPDAVDHDLFWERYLFRLALLQDRLAAAARRQPPREPALEPDPVMAHLPLQCPPVEQSPKMTMPPEEEKSDTVPADLDVVSWEDEVFAEDVELTEEQQTLLLEEYEKEITSKKHTKTGPNNNTEDKTTMTDKKTQNRDRQNNKHSAKKHNKSNRTKKNSKPDECGNNIVENYFGDSAPNVKEDSCASDESWEKEFDIEEIKKP